MNRQDRGFNAEYSNIPGRVGQRQNQPQRKNQPPMNPGLSSNTRIYSAGVHAGSPAQNRSAQGVRVDKLKPVQSGARQGRTGSQPMPQAMQMRTNTGKASRRSQLSVSNGRSRHKPLKRKNSTLRDFLLGLGIGFAVFGTAAIFVVRAITDLFI